MNPINQFQCVPPCSSAFHNFFDVGMGKAGRSRKLQKQQRRIRLILQWLREQTAESALAKVLSRLKKVSVRWNSV